MSNHNDQYFDAGEWGGNQWMEEWTIHVGKAYACKKCGSVVMVTKGGLGILDLKCCGEPMILVDKEQLTHE